MVMNEITPRPKIVTITGSPVLMMNGTVRLSANDLKALLETATLPAWEGMTVAWIDVAELVHYSGRAGVEPLCDASTDEVTKSRSDVSASFYSKGVEQITCPTCRTYARADFS